MSFLSTLGNFVQECLQTNTFGKAITNISDIWNDHKRYRSLWTVTPLILAGGGTAAAFVLTQNLWVIFNPLF